MYKKLLVISLLSFSSSVLFAQELPLSINNDISNQKNKSNKTSFETTVSKYKNHFSNKDINKKGSGYKPFKRWEYHWSHYLQKDRTIAPAKHLWNAWEQKQKMVWLKIAL